MNGPPTAAEDSAAAPFLERLRALFREMDRAWDRVAEASGFVCDGCEDNCCRTRFFHHTRAEFRLLREGFRALPDPERAAALRRAEAVVLAHRADERPMCPLNVDGRCRVYAARPMICRLHGIPSAFRRPDGRDVAGPGCDAYHRRVADTDAVSLDRTPFYRDLARLEADLGAVLRPPGRMKMTVAEMVLAFGREDS